MIHLTTQPHVSRELAAFIPQINRHALVQQRPLPAKTTGTALFADISGFTHLTKLLIHHHGRKKGAEAVLGQINPVYEAMVSELHRFGGSVINFMGDGILCWFDEAQGPSRERALAAALAIQQSMHQFESIPLPNGENTALTVKISIAYGPVHRVVVGDPSIRILTTMAGKTIHRAAELGELAQPGEITVDEDLVSYFGPQLKVAVQNDRQVSIAERLELAVEPAPWPTIADDAWQMPEIRPWLISSVFEHIHGGGTYLGDLRPVTPLMLRFVEPDFDNDPDAHAKLNGYIRWVQQTVRAHGGHLIQLTIGDKGAYLYAPFGAPVAHEDDPRRASLAALALHHPPAEFAPPGGVQIGLSRGDVWTGACGASTRYTYGVMGDDVNFAARLMMKASPGQTVVSEKMVDAGQFKYREIGAFAFKGFSHPVQTYELITRKNIAEKFFAHSLIERQAEVDEIEKGLRPLAENRFAGVISVWGEAGMGKSHIVNELSLVMSDQVRWLEGAFDSVRRESLNPFRQMLQGYFEQAADRSQEENLEKFDRIMAQLFGSLPKKDMRTRAIQLELIRTKPFLGAFIGLHWKGSLYEQLAPNLRFENLVKAFMNFVHALALIHPVVMHLDDAHWMDGDSEKLIKDLIRNSADFPIGIIFGSRYEGGSFPNCIDLPETVDQTVVELKELSKRGIANMLPQVLEREVSSVLVDYLFEKTQGNPFFVQQLALDLRERGLLTADPERDVYMLAVTDMPEIPTTLNTVLVSRLDRLGEPVKDVVQTAAVLGREFDIPLLSHMRRDRSDQIWNYINEAEEAQIWSALNTFRYLFRHVLLQSVAYDMQIKSRLKALHLAAAEAISTLYHEDLNSHAAALAYHFDLGGEGEQAREWYGRSAEQFMERYANREAISAYTRALELVDPGDTEAEFALLKSRLRVYAIVGNRDAQNEDVEQLLALAHQMSDPFYLAQAYHEQGSYFARGNDKVQTHAAIEKGFDWLKKAEDPNPELKIMLYSAWVQASWQSGDYDEAKDKLALAYPLAKEEGPTFEAEVLSTLSIVHGISGDVEGATGYAERALALYQQTDNRLKIGTSLNSLGIQARRSGLYSEAQGFYESGLQIMLEIGFRFGITVMQNNLAIISLEVGQYGRAKRLLERSRGVSRELGVLRSEVWSWVFLAAIHLRMGELEAALEVAELHCPRVVEVGDPDLEAYAKLFLGQIYIAHGRWDNAKTTLRECVGIRERLKQSNLQAEAMSGLVEIAILTDALDEVQEEAEHVYDRLQEDPHFSGPYEPFRVYWTTYQYLTEIGDARADALLQQANRLMQERATKITDPGMQDSFLNDVEFHREIARASRSWMDTAMLNLLEDDSE